MALDTADGMVYYGGESFTLKACKISSNLDVCDTLVMKQAIFSIKCWRDFVLAACQDKSIAIWDLKQKTCMRIVGGDNIVDISTNSNTLCCVDNNGSLRVWQIRSD